MQNASASERSATLWIAVMFFCSLASTFLLRPLRDQFGVDQGVERLPWLYSLTLLATACCVPPFWWLANRTPSRRFVPLVQHVCASLLVLLAVGLFAIGDYEWRNVPWLGEVFWGGFSALNVIVPSLVWIHAVEHFRRDQGQRLFGLVAVGGTFGAVVGSWVASLLSKDLHAPPWAAALVSAGLLEAAVLCFRASLPGCARMREGDAGAVPVDAVASRGAFAGVRLLLADGYLRSIAVYMLLLGMLATAFYAAQTELVGEFVDRGRSQHSWLASVEFWSQTLVLCLQVFATGRLLRRLPPMLFLAALPLTSIVGLGALWLWPAVLAINVVQIVRRGAQFAFDKPAREVLYTPLDLETKHKVKFLLDTFAFRLGDLLGAIMQLQLRSLHIGTRGAVVATIALALVWVGVAVVLGRGRSRRAVGQTAA
ncbi:MAG TPA: Npt1/Npt2 family nucleotide transporter [Planctomycetota bacterium]|nr:Npt1/Npt2 family nucleotide transporter [Planctomycetota bacterium]